MLKYVLFYVEDLARSRGFYERLGAGVRDIDGTKTMLVANLLGQDIWLLDQSKASFPLKDPSASKGSGVYVAFSVRDLGAYYKMISAKGANPPREPENRPWGKEFALRDPDGYVLVFAQE